MPHARPTPAPQAQMITTPPTTDPVVEAAPAAPAAPEVSSSTPTSALPPTAPTTPTTSAASPATPISGAAIGASVMTPAQRLGTRLRQARLQRNMTQSEVAQKQFSVSYISAVERGQIRPSLGALERLSERLSVPLADLLQDRDSAQYGVAERARDGAYGSYGDRQRDEVETRLREGLLLFHQGQSAQAVATWQTLLGRTLSLHDQALVRWRLAQGSLALERGEDARREAQEGLALAERAGDVELREHLREALGAALLRLRRYQLALEQFRLCQEAVQQGVIREPVFQLTVLADLGVAYERLGDPAAALTALRHARDLSAEVTHPQRLGERYQQISAAYTGQQDTTRARYYGQRSLGAYEASATLRLTSRLYTRLGRAQAQQGQTTEALESLRVALDLAEEQQDRRGVAEAQRSLAALYLGQGQIEAAAHAISAAQAVVVEGVEGVEANEDADTVAQAETLLVLAQLQEARKAMAEAEQSYEQAISLLSGPEGMAVAPQPLGDAYAQFSAYLERRGQSKRALDLLKRAVAMRER